MNRSKGAASVAAAMLAALALVACAAASARTSMATSPTCTPAEMARFVATHPIPRVSGPAKPVVTRVITTSATDLNRQEGTALTIPGATPVCYVELLGPFTVYGPPGKTASYARGFEVFTISDWRLVAAGTMN
jgi:hypothetical protein